VAVTLVPGVTPNIVASEPPIPSGADLGPKRDR